MILEGVYKGSTGLRVEAEGFAVEGWFRGSRPDALFLALCKPQVLGISRTTTKKKFKSKSEKRENRATNVLTGTLNPKP